MQRFVRLIKMCSWFAFVASICICFLKMQSMGLLWPLFIGLIKCGWWYFLKRPFPRVLSALWLTFLLHTQNSLQVPFPVISAFKVLAKPGSSQPPLYCSRVLFQNTLPLPSCQCTVFMKHLSLFPRALNLISLISFILDESGIGCLFSRFTLKWAIKDPTNTVKILLLFIK